MNKKMVFHMLGKIVTLQAGLMMMPFICGIIYAEKSVFSFFISIAIALSLGAILTLCNKPKDTTFFAREGFVIVALAWIVMSAIGALPFVLSGAIPSYTDAFFETVSGFTTTGASIISSGLEEMPKCILFWRSFTHWIGGMGVLVLVMAIVPTDTGRSIHIMRAEMPGPIVGKLVPKIKTTAKILYLIYIAMTLVQIILLLLGGMPLFDSIVHSFGTAGTGGFGIKSDSIAGYSAYCQWIIAVFMIIFGVNFNLYYLFLMRKFRSIVKSEELWVYLSIIVVSISAVAFNIYPQYENISDSVRNSAFQVASIISTTGYATADFDVWPTLSKAILFLLMFIGACAGSTAGGLKVSRVVLLFKQIRSNLKQMLHSRSVDSIRLEDKRVENNTITNVTTYFAIYVTSIAIIFLILSIADNFDLETNISAVAACFNNIGPGFAKVGPTSSYAAYSAVSKWTLSMGMLMGRLEILPMILVFAPSSWIKFKSLKRVKR